MTKASRPSRLPQATVGLRRTCSGTSGAAFDQVEQAEQDGPGQQPGQGEGVGPAVLAGLRQAIDDAEQP